MNLINIRTPQPEFLSASPRDEKTGPASPLSSSHIRFFAIQAGKWPLPEETGQLRSWKGAWLLTRLSLTYSLYFAAALADPTGAEVSLSENVVCFQNVWRQGTAGVHPQGDRPPSLFI